MRVVVGENFRFGKGRSGDLTTLVALSEKLGFSARAMEIARTIVTPTIVRMIRTESLPRSHQPCVPAGST